MKFSLELTMSLRERLERKLAASQRLHATPDQQAAPLLVFLIPLVCLVWAGAWWLVGSSLWLVGLFGTACTVVLFRCLPGQVVPLHQRVVPDAAGWFLAGWLLLGWVGMVWLLAR